MNKNPTNQVINFFVSRNIPVTIITPSMMPPAARKAALEDDLRNCSWYSLPGFYESLELYFTELDGTLMFMDRNGGFDSDWDDVSVDTFINNICEEHMVCWERAKAKRTGHVLNPDSRWIPLLLEKGLIEEVTTVSYVSAKPSR